MKRPPFTGLRSGNPNPIVCGRKFCSKCGRWRLISDFDLLKSKDRIGCLRAWCQACQRISNRESQARQTEEQRERRREYQRIWYDAKRREAGIPRRNFNYNSTRTNGDGTLRRRKTKIDTIERILLEPDPIVKLIEDQLESDLTYLDLERMTGIHERQIRRLTTGESARVRVDVADRIAHALGVPLATLYDESAKVTC